MAKKSKNVTVEVEDDELDELEDLEDLADAVEDDADVEEEDDEDEAPKKAKSKKSKKTTKKAKTESDTIGSAELAEALGTSGRELRVMLRQKGVKKNANNRYEWDSVDDAIEELGFDDISDAQEALAESRQKRLEELKERVGAKSKKASSEDEDDEEDEDEEPAPKPKKKKRKK